jgi:hypothetical protein
MNVQTITIDPVDRLLNTGLKNLWYAVCPSDFVKTEPVSLRRFGRKIALWRDAAGQVHALEDHCPHRGAPLSQGVIPPGLPLPRRGSALRRHGDQGARQPRLQARRLARRAGLPCARDARRDLSLQQRQACGRGSRVQPARGAELARVLELPVLCRVAQRLPLRAGQRHGPHARHLPAQAVALHGRGRQQGQLPGA